MPDEPIRVSSASWTGLPAEGDQPAAPKAKKRPFSITQRLGVYVLALALGVYGAYDALSSGETAARWDKHITRNDDPIAFGVGVAAFVVFGLLGLTGLIAQTIRAGRALRRRTDVDGHDPN